MNRIVNLLATVFCAAWTALGSVAASQSVDASDWLLDDPEGKVFEGKILVHDFRCAPTDYDTAGTRMDKWLLSLKAIELKLTDAHKRALTRVVVSMFHASRASSHHARLDRLELIAEAYYSLRTNGRADDGGIEEDDNGLSWRSEAATQLFHDRRPKKHVGERLARLLHCLFPGHELPDDLRLPGMVRFVPESAVRTQDRVRRLECRDGDCSRIGEVEFSEPLVDLARLDLSSDTPRERVFVEKVGRLQVQFKVWHQSGQPCFVGFAGDYQVCLGKSQLVFLHVARTRNQPIDVPLPRRWLFWAAVANQRLLSDEQGRDFSTRAFAFLHVVGGDGAVKAPDWISLRGIPPHSVRDDAGVPRAFEFDVRWPRLSGVDQEIARDLATNVSLHEDAGRFSFPALPYACERKLLEKHLRFFHRDCWTAPLAVIDRDSEGYELTEGPGWFVHLHPVLRH